MDINVLIQVVLLIATGLLGIIAFFLRSIHSDFKQFKEQVQEIKILATNLDTRTQDFFSNQDQKNMIVNNRLNQHSELIHAHDKDIAVLRAKP